LKTVILDVERNRCAENILYAAVFFIKWFERAKRYLGRKMPEVVILPCDQLISVRMPKFLSPSYKRPHPLDAAMSRCEQGQKLIQQMLGIIASAIERLELRMETEKHG